jgi:hypothetical protein
MVVVIVVVVVVIVVAAAVFILQYDSFITVQAGGRDFSALGNAKFQVSS